MVPPPGGVLRVLFLTCYGGLATSSRHRCSLYLDALREAGIAAEVCQLLVDDYVRRFNSGHRTTLAAVLRTFLRRLQAVLHSRYYDLLRIEREALWIPATIEPGPLTAACLAMRRAVLQEIGGSNRDLRVAFNDVVFWLRLQPRLSDRLGAPGRALSSRIRVTRPSTLSPRGIENLFWKTILGRRNGAGRCSMEPERE